MNNESNHCLYVLYAFSCNLMYQYIYIHITYNDKQHSPHNNEQGEQWHIGIIIDAGNTRTQEIENQSNSSWIAQKGTKKLHPCKIESNIFTWKVYTRKTVIYFYLHKISNQLIATVCVRDSNSSPTPWNDVNRWIRALNTCKYRKH